MTTLELLIATVLLVFGLWLLSRLDPPKPTVAEQMESLREHFITFQLVLVDQMTPALERAAAAMEEFAAAFAADIERERE